MGSRAGGNHAEADDAVSLDAHRARRRLPVRPALVAAAVVLIGLIGVGLALHEDGDDSVGVTTNPTAVTGPNVLTAPTGPLRAAGDPVELGAGRVVGVDPTGTFVYLADAAPDGGMGCEGSPAQSLFVQHAPTVVTEPSPSPRHWVTPPAASRSASARRERWRS